MTDRATTAAPMHLVMLVQSHWQWRFGWRQLIFVRDAICASARRGCQRTGVIGFVPFRIANCIAEEVAASLRSVELGGRKPDARRGRRRMNRR
jgi:hypothetical protein